MRAFFADRVRLPDSWAGNVRIEVDGDGTIAAVQPGGAPDGAVRLSGPVVPGMANLHSHAFQRAMAGLAERGAVSGDSFWSWRRTMYDFVAKLTPEDVEAISAHLYVEMLKGGYTGVAEFHYLHNAPDGKPYADAAAMSRAVVAGARNAGIALTHLPVLYMTGGLDQRPLTSGQRRFQGTPAGMFELLQALEAEQGPELRLGLALHSLRAVPARPMREAVAEMARRDPAAPIHIHVAEQLKEVEECLSHLGARPVEFLLGEVEVDRRWCLVHATHMTDAEAVRVAESGAIAGLCPTTEANLGDGLFRWESFRRARGRFGVGSDSHVSLDAREELRLLHYGQRLISGRRAYDLPGRTQHLGARLWLDAAEGGAQALGRATGRIEAGCRADWLVLDADHPALMEREGDLLLDALIFVNAGGSPITHSFIGGRCVIDHGRHAREEEISRRYRQTLRRLLA
ncbi:formimidoylglutamate deiminase [Indioceanicola profundi]|uniref:formimidoylglutamate deiminase n=1 Tax=Indioceanicola profundi TaxID=2220096 RepID=UPI000E6AA4F1|nr:formimidoylglutamate deiminase [Indioceanicola profundi]